MSSTQFFAHGHLFENPSEYAQWIVWRWATANGQNSRDVALQQCTEQSLRQCWQLWFRVNRNNRLVFVDLLKVMDSVRASIVRGDVTEFQPVGVESMSVDAWPVYPESEQSSKASETPLHSN